MKGSYLSNLTWLGLFFQFTAVRPGHLPPADVQSRPWNQSIRPPRQTIRSEIRPPHPDTTTDHRQTRSPNRTIRSHQQPQTRPSDQITPPEHTIPSLTAELQISTAQPIYWTGTGQVHSLWVGSRWVYRALEEPCKAYFPHTFGLKLPDFFRLSLIVVRLVSGFPGLVRASPSLFHRMGSFAGVRSAIRVRLLGIGSAFWIRLRF